VLIQEICEFEVKRTDPVSMLLAHFLHFGFET